MEKVRHLLERVADALSAWAHTLRHIGAALYVYESELELRSRSAWVEQWHRDRGDETLRVTYPLGETSFAIDLGGYHGDWAADIFCKSAPRIWVFEPVPKFARIIERRFSGNAKVRVFRFGLADGDGDADLSLGEDASSIVREGGPAIRVQLREAAGFFDKEGVVRIDLMKINIEGAEYDLLDHLIDRGVITRITDIQVQFHLVPGAQERWKKLQGDLAKTHYLTYQYPFVWENWRLKADPPTSGGDGTT